MLRRILPSLLALILLALHAPAPGSGRAAARSCSCTADCCRAGGPCAAGRGTCPLERAAGPADASRGPAAGTSRGPSAGGPCFEPDRSCDTGSARLATPSLDPFLPALPLLAAVSASPASAWPAASGRAVSLREPPPSPPPRA